MPSIPVRRAAFAILLFVAIIALAPLRSHAQSATTQPSDTGKINYVEEDLPNGLHVIYAPMHNAPVVHMRLLYHVGSRDERPDRQGFAHMFEHMMFRGSAHVAPQEHMRLIQSVGGYSNASTSFDDTDYVDTIPSQYLDMALYLEADRMSSFKVNADIFKTERNVVAQEWRQRTADPPYGTLWQDLLKTVFTKHNYRWAPIGDMGHLRAAQVSELQRFFNTYYVPNNACLSIAGDIDVDQAKLSVRKYFGWIPRGPDIERSTPVEPVQTKIRELTVYKSNIRLADVNLVWKTARYSSDDHYALDMLDHILGSGRTSRLSKALVNTAEPLAADANAGNWQLEDVGVFFISAHPLPGKDPTAVRAELARQMQRVVDEGVTQEELDKARINARVQLLRSRETADQVAEQLADQYVFCGDAGRVNTVLAKIETLTPADIQAVAKKYFVPDAVSVVEYVPSSQAPNSLMVDQSPTTKEAESAEEKVNSLATSAVTPSTEVVAPRVTSFPDVYPTKAPTADAKKAPEFKKGVETSVDGLRTITISDSQTPIVAMNLIMRRGAHSEPVGKEGLATMTAALLRRGSAGIDYLTMSDDLESRGISVDAVDVGDTTRISVSAIPDQIEHAVMRAKQILRQPDFPEKEFRKLKAQTLAGLMQDLSEPESIAEREGDAVLWPNSAIGRHATPASVRSITLDDVKQYYQQIYVPNDSLIVFSGDVTPDRAKTLAEQFLADWKPAEALAPVDYTLPAAPGKQIIVVDNPDGQQATVQMVIRAYDIHSDEKFAGTLVSSILSDGIDSRLGRYVRAEKGYSYGVEGIFRPTRQSGMFLGFTQTALENAEPAIEAMYKVFDDVKKDGVTDAELADAQKRVAGSMVMEMQTSAQQARRRVDGILNGYPPDYYDKLPEHLGAVKADQVRDLMQKFVDEKNMTIIVVAPADAVKEPLKKLGEPVIKPMPLQRPEVTGPPASQPTAAKPAM
jgi:zinc protease